jgi:hypothetical protein
LPGSLLFESRTKTNYPEVLFALFTFPLATPNDNLLEHGEDSQTVLYKLSYQESIAVHMQLHSLTQLCIK